MQRSSLKRLIVMVVTAMLATSTFVGATSQTAEASASDITSVGFYASELIWQPSDPQPVHDTATNTVSSMGPIKDVVCGTVVTFFAEIVMSGTGTNDVLELSYAFGYDSSSNEGLGLRDIVGLTIHPDSTDLDGDASVSLVSEDVVPNPDTPGTVREYTPVIEVTGLDANETIWVQMDIVVGCDPGTGSTGTAQATYEGGVETTSGEPLGGGASTIPGLSPSAPTSWAFSKEAFDADGNPITGAADPYSDITFVFTLENTGVAPFAAPTLSDDNCSPLTFLGGDDNSNGQVDTSAPMWPDGTFGIPPAYAAEVWTWECTMTIGSGDHSNTASLDGMPNKGVGPTESTVSFPVNPAVPGITVTKTVDPLYFSVGDTVTWTIQADNTGNVPLTGVTPSDPDCASPVFVAASDTDADGELDTNEVWEWTCTSVALSATMTNTATVKAAFEKTSVADSGSATATIIGLTLDKQAPAAAISAPGDVTFSFIVTNTGDAPLDIAVDDPLTGPVTCPLPTLPAGDTMTCTATYTVTQDDLDAGVINNTATVTGTAPDGTSTTGATDSESKPLEQNPAWSVVKSTTSTPTAAGDTLDYEFVVSNDGNVSISGVTVTDAKCAAAPTLASGDTDADGVLDVDETWTFSCTSIAVTQAEVDAGAVDNDVSVSGTPAGGTLDPAIDDISTPVTPAPAWSVVKSTTSAPANPGDTLVYEFVVSNDGNVSISGVTVTDAKCAAAPVLTGTDTDADGELDPDETWTYTCTSIPVTQAEVDAGQVDNDVSVSGTPAGGTLDPATGSDSTPIAPAPAWSVIKSTASVPTAAGDTLVYEFAVANDGNVSISGVTVTDAKCATAPVLTSGDTNADGDLDAGETWTFTCTSIAVTQAEVDAGQVDNDVSVSGTPAGGDPLDPAIDDISTPIAPAPAWSVVKSTTSVPSVAGDTLDYSFVVSNDGNVSISGVTVTDAKCAAAPTLASGDTDADGALDPDETWTFTCTSIPVTQAEVDLGVVDNDVSVSGTPAGGTLDPAIDDISTPVAPAPAWSVVKSTASAPANPGDTLNYQFVVSNDGNVSISGVTVTDAKCAAAPTLASGDTDADGALDPDETWTFTCTSIPVTQDEVDLGVVDNDVSVSGTPAGGTLDPTIDDVSTPIAPAPAWSVVKSTASVPTAAGDTLDYEFAVSNDGNVSISGVTVTDAKCATAPTLASGDTDADGKLDADETWTFTCTSIAVTQAEVDAGSVDNDVSVSGTPAAGSLDPATTGISTPITPDPAWSVVKSTTSEPTSPGDTLVYEFAVSNDGNVSISGVTVTDAKCAAAPTLVSGDADADGELDPDEIWTYTCTSIPVTQAEVDLGVVSNTVTVSGTPAGGVLAPVDDTNNVVIAADPSWQVIKAASSTPGAAGDTIDYSFTVVSTGNVSISAVTITDAKCGTTPALDSESISTDGVLQAAETQIWSCTSIPVTQAEVDAGQVDNTVSVTGTPAAGDLDPATDDHSISIIGAPAWELVKATSSTPTYAGQTMTYTFSIVNTGNVTINGVTITDPKCATTPALDSESLTADGALEVGETQVWSCTSIPVTQAEVDAGQVDNSVSATGTPATGTVDPAGDSLTTPVAASPAWTLGKSTSSVPLAAGDTLTYDFALENTGNVSISAITLSDPKCASGPTFVSGDTDADGVLDPGETWLYTCTSIPVTQAEVDAGQVDNAATATGTPAAGSLTDAGAALSTPILADPEWSMIKSTASVPTEAGDTLEYSFTIINTGNVTISAVAIADAKCATTPAISSESVSTDGVLQVGETQIWTCTSIPVTQAEADAGQVDNAASATGTPAGGTLDPAPATSSTPLAPEPSFTVVKSAMTTPTQEGDTIDYSFSVVNNGNVTINGVAITDPKCATTPALISESITADGVLEVGETQVWTCTSIPVTQAEVDAGQVDNTVTVSGSPAGGTLDPVSDDHTTPITAAPAWNVAKTTASVPTEAGDTLDYEFAVSNLGNVTISNITVTDAKCATGPTFVSGDTDANGLLDPGEVWVYTCTSIPVTQAEVDAGQVDNDVTVTGDPAGGTLGDATDSDSTPIVPTPDWSIVKASASLPDAAGDTLLYTFTVINTGNVTISGVAITDVKCATAPVIDSESITADGALEVGETQIWSCTSIPVTQAEVDAGQVDNTATATGTPAGGTLESTTDDHTVNIDAAPAWTFVKSTGSTPTVAGDTLVYQFTVINTGNVTISSVAISDPNCATTPAIDSESIAADGVLEVSESQTWSCTSIPVTQAEVDAGQVDNTATATGTPVGGVLDDGVASVSTPIVPAPAMAVAKSPNTAPQEAGDTIEYSFVVSNTGNVSIANVAVTDAKCATTPTLVSGDADTDTELDVTETWEFTCTSIPVTQAEVDAGEVLNTVTVTGDPAGGTLDPVEDSLATPIVPEPLWTVVKATSSIPENEGDTLDYTFTVVNTGNVTITVVSVNDAKCAAAPVLVSESIMADTLLQVGETQVWSCTSIPVTQAEVDAGEVLNDVTVVGTASGGTLDDATDDLTSPTTQNPSFQVVKSTSSMPFNAGDTLDYTFTVVNDGNVTITNVSVTDAKCATTPILVSESITADNTLEVGETQVWSCTSIPVTQAEVDAGQVDNDVTVTGDPAGGVLDPAVDSHTTPVPAAPSWDLAKSTSTAPTQAGDTLTYEFSLVNTGNVTINGPVVSDAKCATAPAIVTESIASDGVLEVGEMQVWSCTSIPVTQAEVDAGQVLNSASATGTPAGGVLDDATDDLTTPIAANPGLSITKSTASIVGAAGDTITYSFTVINTGNVTIANPTVTDAKCATTPTLVSETVTADGALEVTEVQTFTCTSIPVTQAEVDAGVVLNSATASGDPAGGTLDPAVDDHELPVTAAPSLAVVKATSSVPAYADDTLLYTFTVVNTGNVTIASPAVADPKCATTPAIDSESLSADGVLQVGETQIWSCTSIPVTQTEVDAGTVDNAVTVTGDPAGGALPEVVDELTTPVVPNPDWTFIKATTSIPNQAGDTLEYTFTVVNTGNVTLSGVAVADAKCATAPAIASESIASDGVLEVGETQVWSCTSIPVTQAEVDAGQVDNDATATATPAGGVLDPATDERSTPIDPAPSMVVAKAATTTAGAEGDTIDYSFTVVNNGNVTIASPTITDAKCATTPALASESITADGVLEVGETQVWTCTSVPVTQAEVDAGEVLNTVTVTGDPAGGVLDPATDDHIAPIIAAPGFEMVKASGAAPTAAGQTIDYTFTVVNTGNVTISTPSIADPKCATAPVIASESITTNGVLEVGEVQIWSCTSIPVTQAEVDAGIVLNTAEVSGTPAGGILDPFEDTDTVIVVPAPGWTLAKSTLSAPADAGDTLNYSFTLANTGNVTITGVTVSDPKCASGPDLVSGDTDDDNELDVGEVWELTCTSVPATQAEIDAGEVLNSASATGTPAGGTLPPVDSSVSTDVIAAPSFTAVKTTASVAGAAGDTVVYTFTVINTGNVTIGDVAVNDVKCATAPVIESESIATDATLQVGETQVWSCTSIPVTQDEIDSGVVINDATISGDPAGGTLDPVDVRHTIPVTAEPAVEIIKATPSTPLAAGETLEYFFTLVNTGNVTITNVELADPKCATTPAIDSESTTADGILQVGETQVWSCTSIPVTQAEVDAGTVDNTVTVTGEPAGGLLPETTGTASTPVIALPAWSVVKSTPSMPTQAGETLEYEFAVTNDGNVTISTPMVIDAKCATVPALVSETLTADTLLEVGETQLWTCTSVPVTQDEVDFGLVDNLVTVVATAVRGDLPNASGSETTAVPPAGALDLLKVATYVDANGNNVVDVGDEIVYAFTVTNTGNVTLTNVTVNDPLVTVDGGPIASLAPGETDSTTFTAVYAITDADLDAGGVTNSATATGSRPDGTPVSDTSDDPTDNTNTDPDGDGSPDDPTFIEVRSNEQPAIGVAKSLSEGPTMLDDGSWALTFTLVVENVGDVRLTGVQLIEDLDAAFAGAPYTVSGVQVTSGACTKNGSFDGSGDVEVLSGDDALSPGESCVVDVAVVAQPDGRFAGENQVQATGTSPRGVPVDDLSTIGTSVDDGDGEEPNPFVLAPPAEPDVSLDNAPGTAVTIDPLTNDGGGVPLDPTTVELLDPETGEPVGKTLVVPGEGRWEVDPLTGLVTFTPEPGFQGDPTPVGYQVATGDGQIALQSTIEITYLPAIPQVFDDPMPTPEAPAAGPAPQEPAPEGPLAFTGANSGTLALVGTLLVIAGAAFVLGARRRTRDLEAN